MPTLCPPVDFKMFGSKPWVIKKTQMSMCDLHDNVETKCGILILTQLQMIKKVHSDILLDETVGRV